MSRGSGVLRILAVGIVMQLLCVFLNRFLFNDILTHPCIAAVNLGMFLMFTQIHVPEVLASSVRSIGNCNSAVTMLGVR